MRIGVLLWCLLTGSAFADPGEALALRGATLIDLSDFGRNEDDRSGVTVLIRGERIIAVGADAEVDVPGDARVIDARGQYLVPGLIDAFATINNEAQARAWLHSGVTTVFVNDPDPRRGAVARVPGGPSALRIGLVMGYDRSHAPEAKTPGQLRAAAPALSPTQLEAYVDAQHWDAVPSLLLYYPLDPTQTAAVAARMRQHGMIGIGEVGHTGTVAAARAGVPILVHLNRYLIDLAPAEVQRAVADDPFGQGRARFMAHLRTLGPDAPELERLARALAAERTALMPTFALVAQSLPGAANPWKEPVAAILDPADIMLPMDRDSGALPPPARLWARMRDEATHIIALHRTLARHGVRFIVGSGADAFGALPGVATHIEMEMLVDIGLSPRQALAAATTNLSSLLDFVDYGVIRPGARADLLLLDADPRSDIRHVRRIGQLIVRGELRDRAALLTTPLGAPPD